MTQPHVDRAIALCGTQQPDVVGRTMRAGPMTVEFDNGQLRYLKVNGVEVLRAIGFLVRDENWGTYPPAISNLKVDQRADGFTISFHAVCKRHDQEIAYDATIEGTQEGNLSFVGTAIPKTNFLTARTGFVVLHPLLGVAGKPVAIEHVDGRMVSGKFPELVDPIQPVLDIRSLAHQVMPGVTALVRMEGDTFEMEDHRNWTDASFKTYVRPLSRPWPYTLNAGEKVAQSIKVTLSGTVPDRSKAAGRAGIEVKLGDVTREKLPPLGLGMPAEEIEPAIKQIALLKLAAPRFLICHFDPRHGHGLKELKGYRTLCEQTGAEAVLEVVVESVDEYANGLRRLAATVKEAGLKLSAIAVCPAGDLKSVLPGGARPPAPPLEDLYRAARAAFPDARIGGGMFSFFTELNRKRVPAQLLDFVHNTTCPIVHAADDRSVMETLEALPYQITTAHSFIGTTAYHIGPSGIGCRDNPHGATWTPNPDNVRVCLTKFDPRQRGLFGAAWTLGYVATLAHAGVERIAMCAPTGPLGVIYRKLEHAQPWYDRLSGPAVFPVFHVLSGLAHGSGQKLVSVACSDSQKVQCLAYRGTRGVTLWLANLTADEQTVTLAGVKGPTFVGTLDESNFVKATTDPRRFQAMYQPLKGRSITLGSYAVAFLSIND
jgi:D-apionolactonase